MKIQHLSLRTRASPRRARSFRRQAPQMRKNRGIRKRGSDFQAHRDSGACLFMFELKGTELDTVFMEKFDFEKI